MAIDPADGGLRPLGRAACARWQYAAVVLALLLAPLPDNAQPAGSARAFPQKAAAVSGFVPPGWAIEQHHMADLDGDGRRDVLLLLRPVDQSVRPRDKTGGSAKGVGLSPSRILAVLRGTPRGYALSALNARLVPRVDLAGQEDPLADGELVARRGGFDVKIGLMAGAGSYLAASLRYRFRWQDGCWRLIGYDRLETHRATLDTQDLSINFLTGEVVRADGNAQSDVTKTRRERLPASVRRCLQDLDSAADFKPL